jgi:hypothetical protein
MNCIERGVGPPLVLVNTGGLSGTNPMTRAWCRALGRPAVARRVVPRLVPAYMRCESELDRQFAERARRRARTQEGAAVAATLWRSPFFTKVTAGA